MAIMGAFRPEKNETRYHVVLPPDASLRPQRSLAPVRNDFVDAEFEVIPGQASRLPVNVYNDNFDRRKSNIRAEAVFSFRPFNLWIWHCAGFHQRPLPV
jgi:hypothetical protein